MLGSMSERVIACLSGGVDSSVAASLLVEAGYDVVGVFMRSGVSGQATGERQGCCSVEDALDARRVADQLGIPFYALNMEEQFGRLIDRFVGDYARGRTPNPCVLCNRWFKFGHVLAFARKLGASRVASGHYARVEQATSAPPGSGRRTVARGQDRAKDQSYVLAVLEQPQLEALLLPLGALTKAEVREAARERGLLRVAEKQESQEICFVPGDYRDLLAERLPSDSPALAPGEIQDTDGRVLGRHEGAAGFTVGQRRGLRVAGPRPLYVLRTDPARRLVVVGPRQALGYTGLHAEDVTWLGAAPLAPGERLRGKVQLNAHGAAAPAWITATTDGAFEATLDEPVRAATPGQCAVVYDEQDERVLVSGWITAAAPARAATP
jgi:tRNA-uridine 2-sulfurtransferase